MTNASEHAEFSDSLDIVECSCGNKFAQVDDEVECPECAGKIDEVLRAMGPTGAVFVHLSERD